MTVPIAMSWSGGKDSVLALHALLQQPEKYSVKLLLSTMTKKDKRIGMHQVREELINQQAKSLNLPLKKVWITENPSNDVYEKVIGESYFELVRDGIQHIAFGDIHLEEIRQYRDSHLSDFPMKSVYPIWSEKSDDLFNRFLKDGFKAITICVDSKKLGKPWLGRLLDRDFFTELPEEVDSCGEFGEFHSFVYDGPIFSERIFFQTGKQSEKNGFQYFDLLPVPLK